MSHDRNSITGASTDWQAMIASGDPETKLLGFIERGRDTRAWSDRLDARRREDGEAALALRRRNVAAAERELADLRRRHAEEETQQKPAGIVESFLFRLASRFTEGR